MLQFRWSSRTGNCIIDLFCCGVFDQQVLGEDATWFIVESVARVACGGGVVDLSGSKSSGLEGCLRISTTESNLSGQLEGDSLVRCSGSWGGWILDTNELSSLRDLEYTLHTLMFGDGSDLWIGGLDCSAQNTVRIGD